jgi:hypothetical protein
MRPPIVGANEHVLAGVEIILQAGEAPAVSGPSIVRHRFPRRAPLAVSPIEQDLDLLHVLELVH